ncbi:MAG: lysophospholipid acyltransferase family protein [Candidatus Hodarchaeales archaeon]
MTSDSHYLIAKNVIKILSKFFYRFEVTGLDHIKKLKPPYILAANHHSTIDAIIMGLFVPNPYRVHFLGKKSALWSNKTWALINDFFGTVPVDPNSNTDAITKGVGVLKKKRVLGIFPEGAILPSRKRFEGRTGVARFSLLTGSPVVPCGVLGTEDVLPYESYTSEPPVWPRIGKKVSFHIRPPIYFNQYSENDADNRGILREITDKIMKEIRIASNGYGCPPKVLKQLVRSGILSK